MPIEFTPATSVRGSDFLASPESVNRAATALRLAARAVSRSDSALGGFHRCLRGRIGAPKAITATRPRSRTRILSHAHQRRRVRRARTRGRRAPVPRKDEALAPASRVRTRISPRPGQVRVTDVHPTAQIPLDAASRNLVGGKGAFRPRTPARAPSFRLQGQGSSIRRPPAPNHPWGQSKKRR